MRTRSGSIPSSAWLSDLDVELDLGSKLGDRCVGKLQMATEGEIGTVDLEDETAADDRPVLLAQGIGQRIQEVPAARGSAWCP